MSVYWQGWGRGGPAGGCHRHVPPPVSPKIDISPAGILSRRIWSVFLTRFRCKIAKTPGNCCSVNKVTHVCVFKLLRNGFINGEHLHMYYIKINSNNCPRWLCNCLRLTKELVNVGMKISKQWTVRAKRARCCGPVGWRSPRVWAEFGVLILWGAGVANFFVNPCNFAARRLWKFPAPLRGTPARRAKALWEPEIMGCPEKKIPTQTPNPRGRCDFFSHPLKFAPQFEMRCFKKFPNLHRSS